MYVARDSVDLARGRLCPSTAPAGRGIELLGAAEVGMDLAFHYGTPF